MIQSIPQSSNNTTIPTATCTTTFIFIVVVMQELCFMGRIYIYSLTLLFVSICSPNQKSLKSWSKAAVSAAAVVDCCIVVMVWIEWIDAVVYYCLLTSNHHINIIACKLMVN